MMNLILLILVIVLLIPQPLSKTVRRAWPFFACFFTIFFLSFIVQRLTAVKPDQLQVRSLYEKNDASEGFEVWLQGLAINGEMVEPDEYFDEGWIKDGSTLKWRAYDQKEGMTRMISATFEPGSEIELFFQTNQWRGKAEITYGGARQTVDCYSPISTFDQTVSVKVVMPGLMEGGFLINGENAVWLTLAILVILNGIYLVIYYLHKRSFPDRRKASQNREFWFDLVKVLSAGMVVLIHTCASLYNDAFAEHSSLWLKGLWLNAIPRFAVPCFLMITGALLLKKNYDYNKTLLQKVSRILLPLVFWSAVYVLSRKLFLRSNDNIFHEMLKIPFNTQDSSLWYAYQLIWIYLGMPFWQTLYRYLTNRMRWMFVVFSLVVPGVLTMLGELSLLGVPEYLPFASINVMVCYVGMLFLGCLLYDIINNFETHRVFLSGAGLIAAGLGIMVMASIYVSNRSGQSVHTFFSEVRIPGMIYGSGVFLLIGSLKGWLNKWPDFLKSVVSSFSKVSLGIFMTHSLAFILLPGISIGGREISRYNGSVKQVLLCVVIYYGISAALCLLASGLPGLKRLVL